MARCRYGDLMFTALLLAALEPEEARCDASADYVVTVATDKDGFVVEIRAPMCSVHEAHVSFNPGYRRSVKLRPATT